MPAWMADRQMEEAPWYGKEPYTDAEAVVCARQPAGQLAAKDWERMRERPLHHTFPSSDSDTDAPVRRPSNAWKVSLQLIRGKYVGSATVAALGEGAVVAAAAAASASSAWGYADEAVRVWVALAGRGREPEHEGSARMRTTRARTRTRMRRRSGGSASLISALSVSHSG